MWSDLNERKFLCKKVLIYVCFYDYDCGNLCFSLQTGFVKQAMWQLLCTNVCSAVNNCILKPLMSCTLIRTRIVATSVNKIYSIFGSDKCAWLPLQCLSKLQGERGAIPLAIEGRPCCWKLIGRPNIVAQHPA